jgi:hypothetical protein
MTKGNDSKDEERDQHTAYHEAGHAIAGFVLGWPPLRATIVADGTGVVGSTEFDDWPEPFTRVLNESAEKRRFIEDRIVGVFAAGVAQSRRFPNRDFDDGDERDTQQAKTFADYFHDGAVRQACLENGCKRAVRLVEEHWRWIDAVARALIVSRTLSRNEMSALRS